MTKVKVTEEEFRQFSKYILDISGIALDKGKEYLLETRLNPMMDRFGCTSFSELLHQ
jgi:chemotaxis protein methyltransferase CheR